MPSVLLPSWLRKIGFGKEVTTGTPVVATEFPPFTTHPKFEDVPVMLKDQGGRGSRAADQAVLQGVIASAGTYETFFYPGWGGHYLMAMLGTDTISGPTAKTGTLTAGVAAGVTTLNYTLVGGAAPLTGETYVIDHDLITEEPLVLTNVTGAGPYALTFAASKFAHVTGAAIASMWTHTLTMGTSVPSWTYSDWYNGPNEVQFPGMYYEKVSYKYVSAADFKVTPTLKGWPSVTTTEPSEIYAVESPLLGWEAALTVNSVLTPRLISMDLDTTQVVALQYGANGLQSPNASIAGLLTVEGKIVFAIYDDTERNFFRTGQQVPISLVFNSGADQCTFQMSKVALMPPTAVDTGTAPYAMLSANFTAINNTTDAGPLKYIERNSRSNSF
jgi:hypothetical protein